MHGTLLHPTFSMIVVGMSGAALETRWGDLRYLLTDLICVIVGAPGGVFGLLLAYATYFPNRIRWPILPGLLPGWHPRP